MTLKTASIWPMGVSMVAFQVPANDVISFDVLLCNDRSGSRSRPHNTYLVRVQTLSGALNSDYLSTNR